MYFFLAQATSLLWQQQAEHQPTEWMLNQHHQLETVGHFLLDLPIYISLQICS